VTLSLSLALWAAMTAAPAPHALVVPYQTIGIEQTDVDRLAKALRDGVKGHGWAPLDELTSERQVKSAGMCSEDATCLATIGTRVGAKWVVAFMMAKVGKGLLATALLIDVDTGQQRSTSSEKLVTIPEDMGNLADTLLNPLFRDVPAQVVLVPASVETRGSRLAAPGAALLIGGGVVGVTGLVLSIAAASNFATLQSTPPLERAGPDATQKALNISADVTVGIAIAAVATGLVLLIADAATSKAPSTEEAATP
jgi:hypothetical protein